MLVLPEGFQQGECVGLVILAVVGWLVYRTGAKSKALGEAGSAPIINAMMAAGMTVSPGGIRYHRSPIDAYRSDRA